MSHPDYSNELVIEWHCAEAMEDDYVWPKRREGSLINAAKRRANWLQPNGGYPKKGMSSCE